MISTPGQRSKWRKQYRRKREAFLLNRESYPAIGYEVKLRGQLAAASKKLFEDPFEYWRYIDAFKRYRRVDLQLLRVQMSEPSHKSLWHVWHRQKKAACPQLREICYALSMLYEKFEVINHEENSQS